MTDPRRRVLVVGGGPSGSVTAFWLAKAGFEAVLAERSTKKPYGQGIDVTGPAIEVVKRMGLYDTIKAATTGEKGFAIVGDEGEDIAVLGVAPEEGGTASITQEIEIMRGDITRIFAEAARDIAGVEVRYGCTVESIQQRPDGVTVQLTGSDKPEEFSVVIGADGINSRVRRMTFDSAATKDCIFRTDTYVAFYSMPGDPDIDLPNAKIQQGGRGRGIQTRPIDRKATRASCYLSVTGDYPDMEAAAESGSSEQQKRVLEGLFKDFRGMGPRAIREMCECDDFYFARIMQVKLESWHTGRVGLAGDAAYAPSPLTGQGTTLAIIGGYLLAGELAENPNDPSAAFAEYRRKFAPYTEKSQVIPFGGKAPKLILPVSLLMHLGLLREPH